MMQPTVYYIRHGETDWNVEGRLQGRRDVPLNARGRKQATRCGGILRDLLARDAVEASAIDFVSSPLSRARETMELARTAMGLDPHDYTTNLRLTEISFGEWEDFTIPQLRKRDPARIAQREQDKYHFVPPGGESYQTVSKRVGEWYAGLTRITVAVAHGGTARGLIADLGIAPRAAAPLIDILQGVVYRFEGKTMARYA